MPEQPLPDGAPVSDSESPDAFPVVGVGASAGGLEAFTELLGNLPNDTGMAFVLVLHLAQDQDSQLSQILERATSMPLQEAKEGMAIAPNQVYVIPASHSMTLAQGRLQLRRDTRPRLHRTIDIFFSALAEDCGEQSIGVLLSGANDDGTLGIEVIKAAGGITCAQSEASARVRTMPNTAIATGQVDFTGTPAAIAQELVRASQHLYIREPAGPNSPDISDGNDLSEIFALLRRVAGVDFSLYKETTLRRRIFRRMVLLRLEQLQDYGQYLQQSAEEVKALHREILIGATGFFRDAALFDALKQEVFPALMEGRSRQSVIRLWVAGCSTGEEAYSMGICLLEFFARETVTPTIQIFATDLSEAAIEQARQGIYPESKIGDVSPERRQRFFGAVEGGYQVTKRLREICIFAQQNLLGDPPFSKLDLVSCRNVLIYFKPPAQRSILSVIHYGLKSPGFLVLGSSEAAGTVPDLFTVVNPRQKIYAKQPSILAGKFNLGENLSLKTFGSQFQEPWARSMPSDAGGLNRAIEQALLNHYAAAAVVIDGQLNILQFLGQTGAYIDPVPGQASLNLLRLARPELQIDLSSAVHQAKDAQQTAHKTNIYLRTMDRGASQFSWRQVNLAVIPLKLGTTSDVYFLVLFEEAPPPATPAVAEDVAAEQPALESEAEQAIQQLQTELQTTKGHLQSIIEEQDATNQDLRAANEEILSSNEELQSTNEELQTAKEEIQATNEELSTINEELYQRNAETTRISDDFQNLLGSTHIPIVMVESDLRIRRFTPTAAELFNLILTDVGRPFNDIRHNLVVDHLDERILGVIRSLNQISEEVQDQQGYWYDLRVRPYRTMDDRIDGAVIVLVAIDSLKRSSEALRVAQTYAKAIIQMVQESLLVLNIDLQVVAATQYFYDAFGLTPEGTEGRSLFALDNGQWNVPALRSLLTDLPSRNRQVIDFSMSYDFGAAGRRTIQLVARKVVPAEQPLLIFLKISTVTLDTEAAE